MKKLICLFVAISLSFSINACGTDDTGESEQEQPGGNEEENNETSELNILTVYYSWSTSGNTKKLANQIQKLTGGDIVEIEMTTPYTESYNDLLTVAQNQLNNNILPEIKTVIENLDKYDIILVGHPIWYGHVPPPMQSFLAANAEMLKGKSIAPFLTSGGSGVAQSRTDFANRCPEVTLLQTFNGGSGSPGDANVRTWLQQIGVLQTAN